jgi:hypothetical protein
VSKKDFSELENEMKNFIVGNKIDKLKIRWDSFSLRYYSFKSRTLQIGINKVFQFG